MTVKMVIAWKPDKELQERLLRHCIVKISGCWEWSGYRLPSGYGKMSYKGMRAKWVHRMSFLAFNGPINNVIVRHRCDNPPCFAPLHLLSGTQKDNAADMMARGRHPFVLEKSKTHCKCGHLLLGKNLYIQKNGHRQCLTCIKLRNDTPENREANRLRCKEYRRRICDRNNHPKG